MSKHNTDEIFTETSISPLDELPAGTTRFIDVHIYDQPAPEEQEETKRSEHIIDDGQAQPQEQTQKPHAQPRQRITPILVAFVLLCVVVGSAIILSLFVLPLFTPSATITVVPLSQQVEMTSTITVTPGQRNGAQQVQGRLLPTITMSQAQTIPTTGTYQQEAISAQGMITFYNFATFPQMIPAGELLTGADGVQIVTTQDAFIAAGTLATNGRARVAAKAITTGPGGNIHADDIYGPCCRQNISAVSSAFGGGQDARSYPTVTTHDITSVTTALTTSLQQSVQAALQTQVHTDETLMTPLACRQSVTTDHQPGEEATQVHVMMSETCTGEAYRTQDYHDVLEQMISQQAAKQLGASYRQQGEIQKKIMRVTTKEQGVMELHVKITSTWDYQFSQGQLQAFTHASAGKRKQEATQTLLHMPGVQTVSIETKQTTDTLPRDEHNIRMVVVEAEV